MAKKIKNAGIVRCVINFEESQRTSASPDTIGTSALPAFGEVAEHPPIVRDNLPHTPLCTVENLLHSAIVIFFIFSCFCHAQVFAQDKEESDPLVLSQKEQPESLLKVSKQVERQGAGKWLKEAGFFTGYIQDSLKNQDDLEVVPTGLRFGFDLKPFVEKFGLNVKGMLEILYEPFINTIIGPHNNVELGCAFLFRYSYPLTSKLYPYVEVGSGLYYMTLATDEQSTQFNFIDQGGGGLSYFLKDDLALNVGYRFRHVSNCSIKQPNSGINANVYLAGMSYYF